MKERLMGMFRRFLPRLAAFHGLILNRRSYLHSTGWMASLQRGFPYRADGTPIPWMNFAAISFLEQRLRREHSLFEYGSGHSTLFYAGLAGTVTSVEYDRKWYDLMRAKAPANVTLFFQEQDRDGEYCRSVARGRVRYDVVIVDGRDRVNCIIQSMEHLTDGGVILLDDSCRTSYRPGLDYARERGFRLLDFEGMKPTEYETARATLLYRSGNCFGI